MDADHRNANRLLVVDDDPGIVELVVEVARDLGYTVAAASTKATLLDRLRDFDPTVVTLDLSMPDIDGIEVLELLARQRSRARVMVSSGLDSRLMAKSREIGEAHGLTMSEELPKPFDIAVLEERLAACLVAGDRPLSRDDLAAAIDAGHLALFYQPKIDLRPGQGMAIVGAEALVRWNHESRGLLGPDAFIGLAEETGLIRPLSEYVFREAAGFLANHLAALPELSLAVNLSAESFLDPALPDYLQAVTREYDVPAERMVIEVTESTAMADVKRSMETMTRLRVKGFGLSLDDFGTGFSSLSHLHRMPFTELKVDRSFVIPLTTSTEATIIVRSTIDLAHNLGLAVCAEGVEDRNTLAQLMAFGAETAQGYLFARPMPAPDFVRMVQQPPDFTTLEGNT